MDFISKVILFHLYETKTVTPNGLLQTFNCLLLKCIKMLNIRNYKGSVIKSSRGGGGRHLGGGTKILHFKRRTMEFLLKSWSGDQDIYINLRGGTKIPSNI